MPVATASFLSSRASEGPPTARPLRTIFGRGARGRRDRARHRVADDPRRLHDSRDRGTDFTDNRSDGADASVRLVGRGRWGWSALAYVQTRQFASRYASVNAARTAATLTLDQYNVPATGLGGRIEVSPPLGDTVKLRLGGDIRDTSGRTQELYTYVAGLPTRRREAGGATRTMGLFADGSVEAGALTVTAAARVDDWRIRNGRLDEGVLATGAVLTDIDFPKRSGQEFTGRLGAALRLAQPLTLRGRPIAGGGCRRSTNSTGRSARGPMRPPPMPR